MMVVSFFPSSRAMLCVLKVVNALQQTSPPLLKVVWGRARDGLLGSAGRGEFFVHFQLQAYLLQLEVSKHGTSRT